MLISPLWFDESKSRSIWNENRLRNKAKEINESHKESLVSDARIIGPVVCQGEDGPLLTTEAQRISRRFV